MKRTAKLFAVALIVVGLCAETVAARPDPCLNDKGKIYGYSRLSADSMLVVAQDGKAIHLCSINVASADSPQTGMLTLVSGNGTACRNWSLPFFIASGREQIWSLGDGATTVKKLPVGRSLCLWASSSERLLVIWTAVIQ